MKKVRLMLTDACNFACHGCFNEWHLERSNHFASLDKSIATLRTLGPEIQSIKLTGGEPLLHPRVGEFAEGCHAFAPVSITTNGTLLAQRLDGIPRETEITVSLYGQTAAEFQNHTRRDGAAYARTMDSIAAAIGRGTHRFMANVIVQDRDDWRAIVWIEYTQRLGFSAIRFLTRLDSPQNEAVYARNLREVEGIVLRDGLAAAATDDPSVLVRREAGIDVQLVRQYVEFAPEMRSRHDFTWIDVHGLVHAGYRTEVFAFDGFA